MKKKFTMLLAMLFLVMGTAWAQVSYTVSPTSGTGVSGSGYTKTWTYTVSDANPAALTLTAAGNNMKVIDDQLTLWTGTASPYTYTLQVPVFYRIVSYSFDFMRQGTYAANESVTLTVGEQTYTATTETQKVTVNNVNAGSTNFKMTGSNKGIVVTNFVVVVDCAFEVTTDETKPIWHTIKNVRGNVYAQYNGSGQKMQLSPVADTKGHLFYFTAGSNGGYKIHNAATTNKCADFTSWTVDGIEWYIEKSGNADKPGFAISKTSDLTSNTAWNNEANGNVKIGNWSGNDIGSTWAIERFTGDISSVGIKMSTNDTKYLYNIKNDRKSKFANYTGNGAFSQTGGTNPGSYWYFVEVPGVEGVPEGYKACYIYNAATDLAVQNHSNGFMSTPTDGTYPAKIYFVGPYEATYWGYVIYPRGSNNGWNDLAGSSVTDYNYKTDGSIWDIIPADKTEATLKTEAATAKTNALNRIVLYEYADYYTYADDAIATAKTTVNAATNDNLKNALFGHVTINNAIATLEASAKGATAPAVGDIIQLKNKNDNKYLKANDADANNTDNQNDLATLWSVEAGDDGNVKLKNVSTNKYMGQIRQSETVAMQAEVANAAQFTWKNQTGTYAVFKDVTGQNYAHGHVNGGNLVGWEPNADATQWLVSKVNRLTVEYKLNDVVQSTVTEYVRQGTVYTVSSPIDFTAPSAVTVGETELEATDGMFSFAVTEGATVTVKLVEDLPFTKTVLNDDGSFPANTAWYVVKQHSNSNETHVWKYDANNGVTTEAATSYTENHLWCFAGSKDDLKIYNKVAGSAVSLTNTEPASMIDVNNAVWKMVKSDAEASFAGNEPFCLEGGQDSNDPYLNRQDGVLKYWNAKDEGSTIMVIAQSAIELETLVKRLKESIDAMEDNVGKGLGYYKSTEDVARLKASIDKAQALLDSNSKENEDYVAAIAELNELEAKIVLPEEGKYYRIGYDFGSEVGVRYMESVKSSVSGKENALNMTSDAEGLSTIFYYADGKLQSLDTKKYLKEDGNTRGLHDEGGAITFSAGNTLGKIKVAAPTYLHANINGENYFIDHCGSDGGHAQHNFVVKEVKTEELNELCLQGCTYITALDYTTNSNRPFIVNNARSNWAVADEAVALSTLNKLGLVKDVADTKQQFAIITPDEGKNYYLYSVHAKRYLKSNNTFGAQGEPIAFADASALGANKVQVRFRDVAQKYINVGGSNQITIDGWSDIDEGNACELVQCNTLTFDLDKALDIFNNGADIKLTYKVGDNQLTTTTYKKKGETYSFSNPYAFTTVTSCKKDGVDLEAAEGTYSFEVAGDAHIVVELQENLPFRYAASYDKIEYWYFMKIRDTDFTYMGYDAEKAYIRADQSAVPAESKDAYTWGFVGNPLEGFSIVNYATGKTKVLSAPEAPTGNGNANQLARMVEVTNEYTGNLVWNIKSSTHADQKPGVFYIEHPTATNYAFNRQNYEGAATVCYWTGRDTGSAIQVVERGVFNLSDLKSDRVYALQAERSPLMYSATEDMTTKLSSGMVDGVSADASETNQQFLIIRSKTEGEYYLYSVGAKMFVDANLNFTYYPEPVLSFEANEKAENKNLIYPWYVKVAGKYVVPGDGGTAGNKLYHQETVEDDEGKRYRIVNAGAYDASAVLAVIKKVESLVKSTDDLSNNKVYTVTPKDNATTGVWDVKYDGDNATMLAITKFTGNAVDQTSTNQQFAFLTVNGEHYLYSYGAKKFVAKNENGQMLTDELSDACRVEFLNSTIALEQKLFPLVVKVGGSQLHSTPQYEDRGGIITDWNNTGSGGNAVAIVAVDGTVDLSEAIAKIEAYQLPILKSELKTLIDEAQALLAKNYLDTEDTEKLTSTKVAAKTVYENPEAKTDAVIKQIEYLTDAIAAATYVRDADNFKNTYVYTFVTKRGWVGADANSDNLIGTVKPKVDPAPTPSEDNPMFQWAVYKSANENYYLYNIGKAMFMGMPSGETIPFAATPQGQSLTFKRHDNANWADYPIMFSPDNKGAVSQNGNAGLFYWAGGWNTTDDDGSNHKVTIVGKIADETLTTIAKAVKLYEDAKERTEAIQALEAAIAAAQAKVDATGAALGYYSSNKLDAATELKAIVAFKEGITEDTNVPEIEEQTAAAEAITASFSVNLPEAGKFYRIKNNGGTGYLSTGTGTGRTQFVEGIGESANSVFYYTGTKLLDYTTGLYLATGNGSMLSYTETVGEAAGTTIAFSASPVVGKLLISFNDGNRSFYSNGAGDSDAASKGQTGEHYRFTVEEVTTLPVTVASIGYATLFAPVALQIPDGVNVYVGKIDEDCLILTPINGNVIPANTGVLIEAAPETYTFPIVESVDPIEGNAFTGSYAKSVKNPDKKVYTLQNGKNGVGFYLFKGYKDENDKEGTKTYINGFRSWVELPLSASAQGLRIRKEGTNVEDVELENELFPVIYDLMGRRVEKMDKGIYIVNGKKILVK